MSAAATTTSLEAKFETARRLGEADGRTGAEYCPTCFPIPELQAAYEQAFDWARSERKVAA